MTELSQPPRTEPGPDESGDLFDYALIRDYVGYTLRSLGRHKLLAAAVFLSVVGAAAVALWALPKTYHVETRILAQRNQVMNALGNPNRSIPGDADAPTRAASETVLRRDNLVALIKQTDLIDNWDRTRAPAVRFKDAVMRLIAGPPSDDDRLEALVGLLEKRLTVETGDQTVTIAIDWNDAQMAYRLVEAAQQNFLETRHVTEIAIISEAISILEGHAANVHDTIGTMIDELQRQQQGPTKADAGKPAALPAPRKRASGDDQETAQLRVMLNSKREAIKDVEEFRQKRLAELQTQLSEAKAVYAAAHPTVLNIQQSIDALSLESPQVTALRKEAQELEAELAKRAAKAEASPPEPRREVDDSVKLAKRAIAGGQELNLEYDRSRLKLAIDQYDNLIERIDSARIELDTARAAFKYRYSIIRPAQLPKKPEKPKAAMILGAGAFAALLLAMVASLLTDLRSRRIVEAWQVERLLELPILGKVHRS